MEPLFTKLEVVDNLFCLTLDIGIVDLGLFSGDVSLFKLMVRLLFALVCGDREAP